MPRWMTAVLRCSVTRQVLGHSQLLKTESTAGSHMFSLVSTSTLDSDCVSRLLGAGLFPSRVNHRVPIK